MLLLKVDFTKAFESVSWSFLESTLNQMNFGHRWRSWIKGFLQSAKVSVLINGSPTSEFAMERGLRQGNTLSPFLFILAEESLYVMMEESVNQELFIPTSIRYNNTKLSHLQFADDATFYGEWSIENARSLPAILQCFELTAGLKINFEKTKVFGVGVQAESVMALATAIDCSAATLPLTYLGLPVGLNMNRWKSWDPDIFNQWSINADKFGTWKLNPIPLFGVPCSNLCGKED